MGAAHEDNQVIWELECDEAQHFQSIPEKYVILFRLTLEGAVISQQMSAEVCNGFSVTNHKMILTMLVLKIVEQMRTAVVGILFGHYSAVPVLLRSVLDSISVLHLASKNERQFKIWVFLSYVEQGQIEIDKKALKKLKRDFAFEARLSYDALLSNDPHAKPASDLISKFNAHVHPDVFGLFERAGVQTNLEEILGDSIRQALKVSQGDPIEAIKWMDLKDEHRYEAKVPESPNTETVIFGPGLIEKDLVDFYSQIAYAATHHLFDIVENLFGEYASSSIRKKGAAWHERSMNELETNNLEEDGRESTN